jgi:hypothetical protein
VAGVGRENSIDSRLTIDFELSISPSHLSPLSFSFTLFLVYDLASMKPFISIFLHLCLFYSTRFFHTIKVCTITVARAAETSNDNLFCSAEYFGPLRYSVIYILYVYLIYICLEIKSHQILLSSTQESGAAQSAGE